MSKKTLLRLQAGIDHLCGRLNEVEIIDDNDNYKTNIKTITQENIVDALEHTRKKLKLLYKNLQEDKDLFREAMEQVALQREDKIYHQHKRKNSVTDLATINNSV